MDLKTAIEILEEHNRWRRDLDDIPMHKPKDIGIAIDVVLYKVKTLTIPIVSGSANDLEKDMFKLINKYANKGLKKPDLVKSMKWLLGSCKSS